MNIAEISSTFPPYLAGTGCVCYHNAIELANLGHSVEVYTSNFPKTPINYPDNLKVNRLNYLFRIGNAPFLPQLSILKNYDVIHLHYPFFFGSEFVYLNSLLRNTKYVVTYHNDAISNGPIDLFFKFYGYTMKELILKKAKKIFVTSLDYARNSSISRMLEENPKKFSEIPNGVNIKKYNPRNKGFEVRDKHRLGGKKIILFVGALDRPHFFKGVDILLQSFKQICNSEYHLIIIGDGELKKDYINSASRLGIESYVSFLGRVSGKDLPFYYAASDLVVLPSTTMGEAFGLVLLEAMATGKMAIASDLPGVRSVIDNGKSGFLVEPGNANDLASKIKAALMDAELRNRLGCHGRQRVEQNYRWDNIARILEQEICDIL